MKEIIDVEEYTICAYPHCGRYCKTDLSDSLQSGQSDRLYGNSKNIYCSLSCANKMEGWEKALREVIKIVPAGLTDKVISLFKVTFDDVWGEKK